MTSIELEPFTHADRTIVAPWFDDDETRRFLGGSGWVEHSLTPATGPPTERRGRQIMGRFLWVAREGGEPVGVVDIERYDDSSAGLALVVAPGRRRRGVCRRILAAVLVHPVFAETDVLRLGVEPENVGAARCALAAGFVVEPRGSDEQDMIHFVRSIPR